MMKKLFSLNWVYILSLFLLFGCGKSSDESKKNVDKNPESSNKNLKHVEYSYYTLTYPAEDCIKLSKENTFEISFKSLTRFSKVLLKTNGAFGVDSRVVTSFEKINMKPKLSGKGIVILTFTKFDRGQNIVQHKFDMCSSD